MAWKPPKAGWGTATSFSVAISRDLRLPHMYSRAAGAIPALVAKPVLPHTHLGEVGVVELAGLINLASRPAKSKHKLKSTTSLKRLPAQQERSYLGVS